MVRKQAELYLDVKKLNVPDLAAIMVEDRVAGNEERIKPYKTWIGIDGSTPFPVGTETLLKRRELEGVKAVQSLARQGHRTIVWISPPGSGRADDECKYTEARMIVYQVESIDENKVSFNCTAICSQYNPRECLDLARTIVEEGGVVKSEIEVADDLRSGPVALATEVIDWVTYLEGKMPEMREVFEAIRSGVHEENARQAWLMADVVVREFRQRAMRVTNRFEAIALGVEIERMIRSRFNINLMVGGVHGMSNEAMMNGMGAFDGTYSRVEDSRLQRCNRCNNYYIKKKGKCPDCGV